MVRYRKPAQSRLDDRRGSPGRRAAVGIGAGGGGIALIVAILVAVLGGGGLGDLGSVLGQLQPAAPEAQTGQGLDPANDPQRDLRDYMDAVVSDTDAVWSQVFSQAGEQYRLPNAVIFTSYTDSACGGADSRMGPHYCPLDQTVYLDLSFFQELADRFGATGDFAAAYVMSHEVAHHVQNLLGISDKVREAQQSDPANANQYSIMLELQADCFAGVWASTVYADPSKSAEIASGRYIEIDPGEISEALEAARAVGDDRIQIAVTGRVDPDNFNHGTSEQRARWFDNGYQSGDPGACNTFSGNL